MLNKTKKTSFQWRHPCICILIHVDHGQRPITARVVFTSLYKRISTIKLNTDCICLGHLANNTRSLLNNWNRFHVAVRLFGNRSQMTSKCDKNKEVTHEPQASVSLMFLPHFDVFCDLLLNRCTATLNLFVNYTIMWILRGLWLVVAHDLSEDRYCLLYTSPSPRD